MRILLADDENIEHDGLCRMISAMPLDISEILHAHNGKEALETARRERPEIIITDVRMPVMNGIELLSALRRENRDCGVLFISGYEDFNAIREAMLLGANNWLIKPVNQQELYEMLVKMNVQKQSRDRARQEIKMLKERLLPLEQDDLIKKLLLTAADMNADSTHLERAKMLGLLSAEGQYIVMVADLVSVGQGLFPNNDLSSLSAATIGPVYMPGGGVSLILFFPLILDASDIQSKAEEVSEKWKALLADGYGVPVTVGVSMPGKAEALPRLYRQAVEALREQEEYGKGKVFFFYENAPAGTVEANAMHIDDWPLLLQGNSFSELMEYAERSVGVMEQSQNLRDGKTFFAKLIHMTAVQSMVFPQWSALAVNALEDIAAIYQTATVSELSALLAQIWDRWRRAFQSQRKNRNEEIVRDALAIIERDIAGDLSSETVAGQIYIAASHLRRAFKNTIGMTLQDYILRVRMEKAQELLKNTRTKVSDIARMTGYSNISHFIMTFKTYTKMTPGDFRSRMNEMEAIRHDA